MDPYGIWFGPIGNLLDIVNYWLTFGHLPG
ncbi:hypothetical protein J2X34_002346 [Rhodococcus sp. BE178]